MFLPMAKVAITGAAGRIGGETIAELQDHEITAVDVESVDDPNQGSLEYRNIDIREGVESLRDAFEGADVVVHLAAHADPYETWENILGLNIIGTYNVFEAAKEAGVGRVVFASSNHVTHMHNIDDPSAPETMVADANAVHPDRPPAPDSYYGVSKLLGEGLATLYANRHGLEFVNLRIGWYLTPEELEDYQQEDENVARYARAMYLSPQDCRDVIRAAVESELSDNPLTVNVISRNTDRYMSITETIRSIGFEPEDDSREALDLF
jgi:L-arabinose 1-dehydrogenase [NAD(P)+]